MDTYQINCARKHPICCIKNGMYSGILANKFFSCCNLYIYIMYICKRYYRLLHTLFWQMDIIIDAKLDVILVNINAEPFNPHIMSDQFKSEMVSII